LVFDTKNSWRYGIYSEYKSARKKQQSKNSLDKDGFMIALNSLISEIREYFPSIRVITGDECEGDDIIAVLTKYTFNKRHQEVVIVSGDTDLNQLTAQSNVKQYDPKSNSFFNVLNPKKELEIKVLSGDSSDSIPPIKRLVGPKKAMKILNHEDGLESFIAEQESQIEKDLINSNYERNKKLIDLDFIPLYIRERILSEYEKCLWREIDGKSVVKYLMVNKLHDIRGKWERYSRFLKLLK
jgi:5'-3' exonuclease